MAVTVVNCGVGNAGSVLNMLRRLGVTGVLTTDPADVAAAGRLLVPGVGSFDAAVNNLRRDGLAEAIEAKAETGTPVLGICLGMQLFADASDEGEEPGLGLIPGRVVRIDEEIDVRPPRIPHMGWNTVELTRESDLFGGLGDDARFYFAHSYRFITKDPDDSLGTTRYGGEFTSVVQRDNVVGTQFHPEKSHRYGMRLLQNFLTA